MSAFCPPAALAIVLAATAFAPNASAQVTRTWVAGDGDDTNPCSRNYPCRTFAGAIAKTAPSGEIDCVDAGAYGAATITKSITISCTGAEGGVLTSSTNGIVIAAAATDVVTLKGLAFNGVRTGTNGVTINSAASVVIQGCYIFGFGAAVPDGNGIYLNNSSTTKLLVVDTSIMNNSNGGIWITPTGNADALVTINRVQINNNKFGIVSFGTKTTGRISGIVRDSTVGNNSIYGITATATTATSNTFEVDNVAIIHNGNYGIYESGGLTSAILVGNSTIYGNLTGGIIIVSGAINSYGNNRLDGNNGNDGKFTATIALH